MNTNMTELNLNEMEIISGGWNWRKPVLWGVVGTVVGAGIGGQIGGIPGLVAGGTLGCAAGVLSGSD